MVSKALRIMIADSSHANAWQLEQYLNCLGYYRVVPVRVLDEVWVLSGRAFPPIDVLFINGEMIMGSDSETWNRSGQVARNVFRYDMSEKLSCSAKASWTSSCARVPMNRNAVSAMMMIADGSCSRPSQHLLYRKFFSGMKLV
jgi:hypothetical protein